MRLIAAFAAVALLTTGAMAQQSMDTSNKGNPNRAPGASQTGGKPSMATGQNMDTADKGNPNRPGQTMKKKKKMKKI